MRTVNEVSKRTGISVRTLHYYDAIGLLKPTTVTDAGYRLYDDTALEKLQQILLFRELEFPLKEIKEILNSPHFDRQKALDQQIILLMLKKERLENVINLARDIKERGVNHMDFTAFDTSKLDAYAAEAKAAYGHTTEYTEFSEKSKGRTKEETQLLNKQLMTIFAEFGTMRKQNPVSDKVQAQVAKLQQFINTYFYTCSNEILFSLGSMYVQNNAFKNNIDKAGGEGTAKFVFEAINQYCKI